MLPPPYLPRLRALFSRRVCPCSSRTVVVLARHGRRFRSLAPPLAPLAKAPRFARVGSQPQPPEERSHAGTRFAETDAHALRAYSRRRGASASIRRDRGEVSMR